MKTRTLDVLLGLAALPAIVPAVENPPATPGPCNRACLEGFVDRYLVAMQNNAAPSAAAARSKPVIGHRSPHPER